MEGPTEKAAFHAGHVMLERLQLLTDNGESFALETTLASGELDALATISKRERVQIEGERKAKRSQI